MSDRPATVLIVEDEPQMRMFLRVSLAAEGHQVVEASAAEEGLALARSSRPDVVLLDLGLPDMDGMQVTERLREWTSVPIIVISARGREHDKIGALDRGADDYLTKPFGIGELMARVRVALRNRQRVDAGANDPVIAVGDLSIDLDKRIVRAHGAEIHLSPHEYELFSLLMKNAGKVLTHRQLLEDVWGRPYSSQTHYLRVYMTRLRHKLERDPARPRYLVTEPGVGYRLKVDG